MFQRYFNDVEIPFFILFSGVAGIEEIGDTNARVGQFFTPHNVCELMTDINISCSNTAPVLLSDPAAGSGRFMLSVAKKYAIKTGKLNFIFVNQDIDFKCFVYSTMNAIAVIPQFNLPVWHILDDDQLLSLHSRLSCVPQKEKVQTPTDLFDGLF